MAEGTQELWEVGTPVFWYPESNRVLWRAACSMTSLAPPKTDGQKLGLSWAPPLNPVPGLRIAVWVRGGGACL